MSTATGTKLTSMVGSWQTTRGASASKVRLCCEENRIHGGFRKKNYGVFCDGNGVALRQDLLVAVSWGRLDCGSSFRRREQM